jgi:hypothetical protein
MYQSTASLWLMSRVGNLESPIYRLAIGWFVVLVASQTWSSPFKMALRIAFLSRYSSKLNYIAGSRHPPSDLIRRLDSYSAIVMFAMVTQKEA